MYEGDSSCYFYSVSDKRWLARTSTSIQAYETKLVPREHMNKNMKLLNCDSFSNTIWHCLAPCNEFRNPANFCVWNPESSKVLPEEPESWVCYTTKDGNSESKFHRHRSGIITWNPKGIPNPRLSWVPLHGAIGLFMHDRCDANI